MTRNVTVQAVKIRRRVPCDERSDHPGGMLMPAVHNNLGLKNEAMMSREALRELNH